MAARGALQPARSPGAGPELFSNRLAVLEALRAFLDFEREVPVLHRSWGRWRPGQAPPPRRFSPEEARGQNRRPLPWQLLGNELGAGILWLGAWRGRSGPPGLLWRRLKVASFCAQHWAFRQGIFFPGRLRARPGYQPDHRCNVPRKQNPL